MEVLGGLIAIFGIVLLGMATYELFATADLAKATAYGVVSIAYFVLAH